LLMDLMPATRIFTHLFTHRFTMIRFMTPSTTTRSLGGILTITGKRMD
jgi:hypothetical protein